MNQGWYPVIERAGQDRKAAVIHAPTVHGDVQQHRCLLGFEENGESPFPPTQRESAEEVCYLSVGENFKLIHKLN